MRVFTPSETREIVSLANDLGVPSLWLVALIDVESSWRPKIINAYGAAGLNQIIPSTAAGLGLPSRSGLVTAYPTIVSQLRGPTRKYLMQYKPFTSLQDFALSNFSPAYRKKPDTTLTPLAKARNPSYRTYADYAWVVEERVKTVARQWQAQLLVLDHPMGTAASLAIVGGLAYWFLWHK